jgi:hypothetical protein
MAKKSTPRYASFKFKTVLANESGDPGVPFNKKPRVENLVILSL